MRVDVLGLQAFVAIAERGSFRAAASHLNLSQTALSPIANVCDAVYSVVCKIPKRLLGQVNPFAGKHAELRRQAERHSR